ncbi:glycerate kinase [Geomonas subterranea]|uniref:Glycerate kinase n=1 Tax=Geomonas subterranea TaxID=2847989 RepID=A0ABX8LFH8_9BACT|nr:glycerate kinase [Geomonas subterranea]QXE90463.1 glycerate kinase [Geomonas subterranea]QXM11461.1 glycerate kinase [Geomonas subterranea]
MEPRKLLQQMFEAAVQSARPEQCLSRHLPVPPKGRVIVIGAGKAAAAMARAFEDAWQGEISAGLVVTRYGYEVPCSRIEVVSAAHPVPDQAGCAAAARMLELVRGLTPDDLVLCLISGGGSALLPLPLPGVTLAQKQELSRELLRCGAGISEINCVRRHLSAIKGGRLAAACHPARVLTLAISDVPGDSPTDIASGPTVADATTCADALAIVDRYRIALPEPLRECLSSGRGESVKPPDPRLGRAKFRLVATPQAALEAAALVAHAQGITPHILSDRMEGESREVGKVLAALALQVVRHRQPFTAPCVLLSGGETTVTVRGGGRGGRNVELLLALALALQGEKGIYAMAGDTDGVDGQEEIAGAFVVPDLLQRAWDMGINPRRRLDDNDGHGFFEDLGETLVTGPTLTNVNDFRAILITG